MRTILVISITFTLIVGNRAFFMGFPPFNSLFNNLFSMTKPLFDNLSSMSQQMHSTYEQLRNVQKLNAMANGHGGITLAFYPTGKVLIISNGQMYECDGYLDASTQPHCNGDLRKFKIYDLQDYCYTNNYVNDDFYYCLSSSQTDAPLYSFRNGNAKCISLDNDPTVLLTKMEYKQLCRGSPNDVIYKFYPNNYDFFFQKNNRKTLGCLNNDLNSCIFHYERKVQSPYQYTAVWNSKPGDNYKTVMIRT